MTYKGASFIILFWGISGLLSSAMAYYFMGSFAASILISGVVIGLLGFGLGHFLNRGSKEALLGALAAAIIFTLIYAWLTTKALTQEQNYIYPDTLANSSRNVFFLVSSGMLTSTGLMLVLFLVFYNPIHSSLQNKL